MKDLATAVPGRLDGSTIPVLAVRGDAKTGQLEVVEVHDNSLTLGDIPADAARRVIAASDFRPWPQTTRYIGGQPFIHRWAGGHARCARCEAELEHFAYNGTMGGDVRERGLGVTSTWYCESCVRGPLSGILS